MLTDEKLIFCRLFWKLVTVKPLFTLNVEFLIRAGAILPIFQG